MIHSIVPDELIFDTRAETPATETGSYLEVEIDGVRIQVESLGSTQVWIVRLLSPNPYDYLNPSFSPGSVLDLVPRPRSGQA